MALGQHLALAPQAGVHLGGALQGRGLLAAGGLLLWDPTAELPEVDPSGQLAVKLPAHVVVDSAALAAACRRL